MARTRDQLELEKHGIKNVSNIYWNLTTPVLYEHAIRREEGHLSHLGPFVVSTGQHTGRAPNDKFIVKEPSSEENIWWGKVNVSFDKLHYDISKLHQWGLVFDHAQRKGILRQDVGVHLRDAGDQVFASSVDQRRVVGYPSLGTTELGVEFQRNLYLTVHELDLDGDGDHMGGVDVSGPDDDLEELLSIVRESVSAQLDRKGGGS